MSEFSPELNQIIADGKLIQQQIAAADIDPAVKHLLGEILALHEGGLGVIADELEALEETVDEVIEDEEEIVQEDRATVIMTGLAVGFAALQKLKEIVAADPASDPQAMPELLAAEQQIVAAQHALSEITIPASADTPNEEPDDGHG
jgi:hypothetical protein